MRNGRKALKWKQLQRERDKLLRGEVEEETPVDGRRCFLTDQAYVIG